MLDGAEGFLASGDEILAAPGGELFDPPAGAGRAGAVRHVRVKVLGRHAEQPVDDADHWVEAAQLPACMPGVRLAMLRAHRSIISPSCERDAVASRPSHPVTRSPEAPGEKKRPVPLIR